jgi:hypothetical protein
MDETQKKLEAKLPYPEKEARERRTCPRAGCWGTVWINLLPEGVNVVGYLRNLSQRGCYIEADDSIPSRPGGRVEVLLHLGGSTLRLAGVIRHLEENNARAGIEFTNMSPRKAEQIRRLMENIAKAEKERLAGVKPLGG